jgi:hypothetical protein
MTPLEQTPAAGGPRPAGRPRTLSAQECWAQLREHEEGRLGYLTGRGPRHVVRPYAVRDRTLVVRVPAYDEAAQFAGGRQVTFDVSARLDGQTTERIDVVARARLVEPLGDVLDALPDERWPSDLRSWLVYLDVDAVSGSTQPLAACGRGAVR